MTNYYKIENKLYSDVLIDCDLHALSDLMDQVQTWVDKNNVELEDYKILKVGYGKYYNDIVIKLKKDTEVITIDLEIKED